MEAADLGGNAKALEICTGRGKMSRVLEYVAGKLIVSAGLLHSSLFQQGRLQQRLLLYSSLHILDGVAPELQLSHPPNNQPLSNANKQQAKTSQAFDLISDRWKSRHVSSSTCCPQGQAGRRF